MKGICLAALAAMAILPGSRARESMPRGLCERNAWLVRAVADAEPRSLPGQDAAGVEGAEGEGGP